jgi:hypothetical protein
MAGRITRNIKGRVIDGSGDLVWGITQTSTPATGTNGTQFVFKDLEGVALVQAISGIGYISNVAGQQSTAITSVATLTNGDVTTIVTGKLFHFTTEANGTLGITFTGGTGAYYCSFVLPTGKIFTSSVLTVN